MWLGYIAQQARRVRRIGTIFLAADTIATIADWIVLNPKEAQTILRSIRSLPPGANEALILYTIVRHFDFGYNWPDPVEWHGARLDLTVYSLIKNLTDVFTPLELRYVGPPESQIERFIEELLPPPDPQPSPPVKRWNYDYRPGHQQSTLFEWQEMTWRRFVRDSWRPPNAV